MMKRVNVILGVLFFLVLGYIKDKKMLTFILPKVIKVFVTKDYIKRVGPNGTYIKRLEDVIVNTIFTVEGSFIFISNISAKESALVLASIHEVVYGLFLIYRCRLSLQGIGYRVTIKRKSKDETVSYIKSYMRKRFNLSNQNQQKVLNFNIGTSHPALYPMDVFKYTEFKPSRPDSPKKGTLLSIKSNS
jgi:ribosomal protein L6P/L9E